MKKVAIIYSSYDGIINSYCGVGMVTQAFIESFSSIRNYYLQNEIDLQLHLVTPALLSNSLGFNSEFKDFSLQQAQSSNGSLHFITNDTDGSIPYGNRNNWQAISHTCASKILEIAAKYDQTIAYCVDTPFMHTPQLADQQKRAFDSKNIQFIITLHSDALIHEPNNPSIDRLAWEAAAIKNAIINPNIYFASTSVFLQQHLKKEYAVPSNKFLKLQTGVYPPSPRYKSVDKGIITQALQKYHIPLDRDLIFSVGRAVPYKGFDLLINAVAKSKKKPHLVFIASPYKKEDSNVNELQKLLVRTGISATPIFQLDFDLPKKICQWEKTKIVAQLSSYEPFGLVPEEVRLWAGNKGPVILASNRDGHKEQITDGVDGFLVNIDRTEDISQKIDDVLSLPAQILLEVRKLGFQRAMRYYDYRLSVFNSLNQLLTQGKLNPESFKQTL